LPLAPEQAGLKNRLRIAENTATTPRLVLADLDRHNRNVTQTAKSLGLERSHLYKKCQQLGIDLQSLPERE